jgi:CxxC motif-containing protein (DUF1111 family)
MVDESTTVPALSRRLRPWWLVPCVLLASTAETSAPPVDAAAAERGREVFEQLWSVAPSAFGRWGRGPLSSGEACTDCHAGHGRGTVPGSGEPLRAAVLRLAGPGTDAIGAPLPDPVYGHQLQTQGVLGRVPPEGEVHVTWTTRPHRYPDGATVELRMPHVRLARLAHGPIDAATRFALRLPPALRGIGLLEAIPEPLLRAAAALPRPDGVRGRLNRVADGHGGWRAGRFGHKAAQPGLREQVLSAFHEDLGVTSTQHPAQNCMPAQAACRAEPSPSAPEVDEASVADLLFHLRRVPPPSASSGDPAVARGRRAFEAAGCVHCHVPTWTVTDADGIVRRIESYTDLLLHDLGPGLADGGPEFEAAPADWRTAPLWGVGGASALLHDGRARSPEEAILWHDGEAAAARRRFESLDRAERSALLRFLESLR